MAFKHGKSIFVLLNGYNITEFLSKIDTPMSVDTAETSCFGNDDKTFIGGLKDATLSADGMYDGAASAIDEILSNILSGVNNGSNILWMPGGNVIGEIGYAMNMIQTSYNTMGTKDDATRIGIAGQSSVGRERVKLIHELKAETITGASASQNLGSAGANGGSACIHATAVTGTLEVVIEHSTTGDFTGEETTLCTFTDLTASGHERLVFAGAVKQYVRAKYTITTGPATFSVAICKK